MSEFSYFPIVLNDTLVKNSSASAGDTRDVGLIPGSGRFPGGEHGNPFQYSCLENPMDRGAWRAIVYRVTESDTTEVTEHTHNIPWYLHTASSLSIHPMTDTRLLPCTGYRK